MDDFFLPDRHEIRAIATNQTALANFLVTRCPYGNSVLYPQ